MLDFFDIFENTSPVAPPISAPQTIPKIFVKSHYKYHRSRHLNYIGIRPEPIKIWVFILILSHRFDENKLFNAVICNTWFIIDYDYAAPFDIIAFA